MERQELDTPALTIVGLVATLATFVVIVAIQAAYYHYENGELERKQGAEAPAALSQNIAEEQKLIYSYRMLDSKANVVAIPVERAMELIVQEAGQDAAGKGVAPR